MNGETKGILVLSIGETSLSAYEASTLKAGDIVLTNREAGYPALALFNGLPIAYGEIVLLNDAFGLRLVDSDFKPEYSFDLGNGPIGDRLPTVVSLGSIHVDMTELLGLESSSIIYFGQPCDGPSNAELLVAGAPAARGKVVVVGESFALRVTEPTGEWKGHSDIRFTGAIADAAIRGQAKDYDFRRPDRWSFNQIEKIRDVHTLLRPYLAGRFPASASALDRAEVFVDQCTMEEAVAFLAKAGLFHVSSWEQRRVKPRAVVGRDRRRFYEAPFCPRPLSEKARRAINEWMKGSAWIDRSPLWLYRPDPAKSGAFGEPESESLILASLRDAWRKHLDLDLCPAEPPIAVTELDANEMAIIVHIRGGDGIELGFVYPYLMLEPYMGVLGR